MPDILRLLGLSKTVASSKLSRRSFLKGAAGAAGAVAVAAALPPSLATASTAQGLARPTAPSAPLFIPSNRLSYVPRQITRDLPESIPQLPSVREFQYTDTVEMLMVKDTYYPAYGSLRANDTVRIRTSDAARWLDWGIAVPTPNSPASLQPDTSRRAFEAAAASGSLDGGPPYPWPSNTRVSRQYAVSPEEEYRRFMDQTPPRTNFARTVEDEFRSILDARRAARAQGIARPATTDQTGKPLDISVIRHLEKEFER